MKRAVENVSRALVGAARRVPRVRRVLLHPVIARPGYWFASACGFVWGSVMSAGRIRRRHGVWVARKCPRWSFGGGGTMIGAVFITHSALSRDVLEHEAVHRAQWRRYGLAFIPLYFAAGFDGVANRFEIEADLVKGGYVPRGRPPRSLSEGVTHPRSADASSPTRGTLQAVRRSSRASSRRRDVR